MTRSEFENTVLPLSRNLYRLAFRFLSSAEDAEDAVQEVYIKLWNMKEKLGEYRSIEALARTMTRNHSLDKLRRRGRELNGNDDLEPGISDEDIEHSLEVKESFNRVLSIVDTLPRRYSEVLKMRDIDGMEYTEIAEMTGESINNIRVNLSRARKMVREKLIELSYEPTGT